MDRELNPNYVIGPYVHPMSVGIPVCVRVSIENMRLWVRILMKAGDFSRTNVRPQRAHLLNGPVGEGVGARG